MLGVGLDFQKEQTPGEMLTASPQRIAFSPHISTMYRVFLTRLSAPSMA
jgi:hypothetical protein